MDQSFFQYLEQLELIGFFSGYPIVYLLVYVLTAAKKKYSTGSERRVFLLPVAYALVGLLFIGYEIKKIMDESGIETMMTQLKGRYLLIWGLSSVLFFIPFLRKKPVWSFLHSLVFFSVVVKDLINAVFKNADPSFLKNTINLYTGSMLLHGFAFALVLLLSFLNSRFRKAER